ncbi:GNAT family N-acetyltransferase [Dactylosporangium sp. NPDC049742]|uniref:GNAT family N-acetyltransferase n=1 Tax=Dactylosporangium sp. NPDC049742 TaxID=3154737 RepID=UPI003419937C
MRIRAATDGDVDGIARLHADSWRRHYRGAYSDAFLDGDVVADRLAVWRARFEDRSGTVTLVADDGGAGAGEGAGGGGLVGFAHVMLDDDVEWGSLVDNLHVADGRRHGGVGTRLLRVAAGAVVDRAVTSKLYLWVLAQNLAAQRFYAARGGVHAGTVDVTAAGGVPGRLQGTPRKHRIVWTDADIS